MTAQTVITLKKGFHKNEKITRIEFPYNLQVMDLLRKNTAATWSRTLGCWWVAENNFDPGHFFTLLKPVAWIDYSAVINNSHENNKPKEPRKIKPGRNKNITLPKGYLEKLEQERYSENTNKIYIHYFKDFATEFSGRRLPEITKEEINEYILRLIKEKGI